jgi:anti-anti-sigma factor
MVVRSWREESCTVIQPRGDLDVSAAPRMRAGLEEALAASGDPPLVVLDLTEVPFCDSVGLGVLVTALNNVSYAGGRLILVVAPGMISHLLTITNLDRHFTTTASVTEARTLLDAAA